MGVRYRKSVKLGLGFRVNISKSGIGYSWGVPGYRITKTASGRTRKTYSIPGTGLSYVEENSKKKSNNLRPSSNNYKANTIEDNYTNISIANVEELKPLEFSDLISALEKSLLYRRITTILCLGLLGFLTANLPLISFGIIGAVLKILLSYKGTPYIEYNLDAETSAEYSNTILAINNLQTCKKIWDITAETQVSNQKMNAGASRHIKRASFSITTGPLSFMKTNVDTASMILSKKKIIFLPDKIFIVQGIKVGIATYKDLNIHQGHTRFIESQSVPGDAEIVDHTWQYVNKNGSPDKRFKNNRRLPICKYGSLRIWNGSNLNIEIMCSDYSKSKLFSDKFLAN